MEPNPRSALFVAIKNFLRGSNLQFFERKQEAQFVLMMRGPAVTVAQVITVAKCGEKFRIETRVPLVVPAERRLAAMELVTRLNRQYDRGRFDIDLERGDVQFRLDGEVQTRRGGDTGADLGGPGISQDGFVSMLKQALAPVMLLWSIFDAVLMHDGDPRQLLREHESTIAARVAALKRAQKIELRRIELMGQKLSTDTNLQDVMDLVDELTSGRHQSAAQRESDAEEPTPEADAAAGDRAKHPDAEGTSHTPPTSDGKDRQGEDLRRNELQGNELQGKDPHAPRRLPKRRRPKVDEVADSTQNGGLPKLTPGSPKSPEPPAPSAQAGSTPEAGPDDRPTK